MESNKDVALYHSNQSRYNRIGKRNAVIIVSMALLIIFISFLFLF
ncbi:hypothetical protein [Psychrobacillus sp. FJAT-21963]|nr:hypothetical protein [Psychrobacillus sp. FJAT-21963]